MAAVTSGTRKPPAGRSTAQKRAIAAVLADTGEFRSAQELHASLRSRGERVGLTTVYNQLRALAEVGGVDVVRAEDGESLYRQCRSAAHHHHLVCRRCGRTVEVDPPDLERWTADVARTHGFVEVGHVLEVVGTCGSCRTTGRPGGRGSASPTKRAGG